MTITETEKAYIAGYFDGEGCVSIARQLKADQNVLTYRPVIIVQHDRSPLQRITDLLGFGKIYEEKRTQSFRLVFVGSNAVNFLNCISGYLYQKSNEASLAIEFMKTTKQPKRGLNAVSPEMDNLRKYYWDQMQLLKQKGRSSSAKRGRPVAL